jgi:maltooligosyltrehalose trehalohydrolase
MSQVAREEIRPSRRLPVGAELLPDGRVHFRVYAGARPRVAVLAGEEKIGLRPEGDGYFSGAARLPVGARYWFELDGAGRFPDPASRFQPEGPHGPSQIVDPAFPWTDHGFPGLTREGQVLYELHVGTFTPEGTYAAAARELPALAELGVTTIELMPLHDFPGRFGWGYDGVCLFAPCRLYGTPDDLRRLVDRAHALGLGVILDVVYNHFGPDGCYLAQFSPDYFTDRYKNEWGQALNFDGPGSGPIREFFIANASYWITEFHLDGLRLDATQAIVDRSDEHGDHILAAIGRAARAAAGRRSVYLVAENEPQEARLVRPLDQGGYGLCALWNDDFHHAARVALTGRHEAYYSDYRGTPQELVSAARWGYLFQGQHYVRQDQPRGTPALDLPPAAFVHYIENHDQVANALHGLRSHKLGSPARHRALTALLLLGPQTPLLFQGQEFAASAPFLFFADHKPELARLVHAGRRGFLTQFPSLAADDAQAQVPDPVAAETFARCKLDRSERERHAWALALHRDLLRLRRDGTFLRSRVEGAVLGARALLLRDLTAHGGDRLLLVNLGADLPLSPAPEPLLAPPAGRRWQLRWSSEEPRYGGGGTPAVAAVLRHLPGESALLFTAEGTHG